MKISQFGKNLDNKGALKRNIWSIFIFVILLGLSFVVYTSAQSDNKYTIVGNSVEWNNSYGFIRVTPHTIYGIEGCFNVTVKNYMATQDLDCALIANSNKLQLTNSEYLTTTSANVSYNYTCPTANFSYTTNPNRATCYANNGTLLFNGRFDSVDLPSKTVSWNVWTPTDAWTNIPSNRIAKSSYNARDVYSIEDVSFATNAEKTIRVCGNAVSKFNTEKFDVGCKRNTDTWFDVISSGNYIIVDPSWNYTEQIVGNVMHNCTSSGPFNIAYMAGYGFTVNRINVSLTNITINPDCGPNNVRLYLAGQNPVNNLPLRQYNLTGNEKRIPFNYTLNNSLQYYIVGSGPTGHGSNWTLTYANGGACPNIGYPISVPPYVTVDTGAHSNSGVWNNISIANYCFTNLTFANATEIASPANQSENSARTAIQNGIISSIPSATIYTDQQIYVRYLNGTQMLGTFDKVAVYGNQRWAFNAIFGSDSFTNMMNITPSFYVWEGNSSLSDGQIQVRVETLINSTIAS